MAGWKSKLDEVSKAVGRWLADLEAQIAPQPELVPVPVPVRRKPERRK